MGRWRLVADRGEQPALSDEHWTEAGSRFLTIQSGDINGTAMPLSHAASMDPNLVLERNIGQRLDDPTAYGLPAFTGSQATAYDFVGVFTTIDSGQTVPDQYTTDPTTLGNYKGCLFLERTKTWNDWTEIPTETCNDLGDQTSITPPSG
ncbi:MAG: hypothetical protein R2849_04550 [Thermomicrobiales bacterium]